MFTSKTFAVALAGMASLQTMAAPVAEPISSSELATRDSGDDTLWSSTWDIDLCMWQSGFLFVGWSVLMKQVGNQSPQDMVSATEAALKKNSACNSYSWMKVVQPGVGAHNTTMAISFNTDDFCTASTMSGILNSVSGRSDFGCSSNPQVPGDPDLSNTIAETIGDDGTDDPSEEKVKRAASPTATATATATSSTTTPTATPTGQSDTAHPQGLAGLTESTVKNGTYIHSVLEMAQKMHLPSTATREEVIEAIEKNPSLLNA